MVLLAVAGFVLLALITYDPRDPAWSYTAPATGVHNAGGVVGAFLADLALYLFGYLAFLFPVLIASAALMVYRWQRAAEGVHWGVLGLRFAGFVLLLVTGDILAFQHFAPVVGTVPLSSGGMVGSMAGAALSESFGFDGATMLALAGFLAGITVFTGLSWIRLMDNIGRLTLFGLRAMREGLDRRRERRAGRAARREREVARTVDRQRVQGRKAPQIDPLVAEVKSGRRVEKEKQIALFRDVVRGALPPVSLLDEPRADERAGYSREALEAMSRQLELKLRDFGVEIEVAAVQPGPVITRFEVQPAPGVKVSQISNLAKDLARALSVTAVRVVEVIPGKSVVGLEIPNERRQVIAFSEIVRPEAYERSASPLTLAIGKDIGGAPVVVDLAKMPHLLVAGTTGSGKSVGVNAMILSLLYKNGPGTVRTIMIDPKMLELSVYDDIPHLLAPVVTDMKEAANALRWCVAEMERRYRLMAALGVRNIAGCNRRIRDARGHGEPLRDPLWIMPEMAAVSMEDDAPQAPELQQLPYLVVVVDEFADMMMMVGKKVEELIARLAQKARAAGIHLILATQRPSVDVITGLIKANIPTRMAFQVSAKVDSRTILDQMGAESLLGHGDMLYLGPSSRGIPERVHGAFVSDAEVHRVAEHLKRTGEPDYVSEILHEPSADAANIPGLGMETGEGSGEGDPLYDQAVRIVTETRKASISGVQRRLKIGYNRAARLVDGMEVAGIVGSLQANGAREVLAPPPPPD